MNLDEIKNAIEQRKGIMQQIKSDIESLQEKNGKQSAHLIHLEKAREIVKIVGLKTQQNLQFHISDIASLALNSIFPDPYKLVLDFVERRNKTECDVLFERNGERIKPVEASGVGAIDIASFALRIASWSMGIPRTRPIIILDEPFKHLSSEYHQEASEMIKNICDKLGVQFIMVTHNKVFAEHADKVFTVKQNRRKISIVK